MRIPLIPDRGRRWTNHEVQEWLNGLGREGAFGPFWKAGDPWGAGVQPYMVELGKRGAFGPEWIARYEAQQQQTPTPEWDQPQWAPKPKPKPKRAAAAPKPKPAPPQVVYAVTPEGEINIIPVQAQLDALARETKLPEPKPEPKPPDPILELFKAPAPRKPKPPKVSVWDITPEQEAEFTASAARATGGEIRAAFLADEGRFQANVARIAAMRARKRLERWFELGELTDDHYIHVVGWNTTGRRRKEEVRKERLAEIDD